MTSQNNIFGRNIFNPGSSGIMKKGQLPGHSNTNIFGQSNAGLNSSTGISGIGISNQNSQATTNPFAAIFGKPFSGTSNNTTAGIFGQKDSNSNQSTGYNFLGKSNTQSTSPFGLNNSSQGQSPFFRTGPTGQNNQTNSSGNINFANLFSANKPNTTQNTSNTNNTGGIFSQNQQNSQNSNQNIFGQPQPQPQPQTSFIIGGQPQPQNNNNGGLFFQGQNQSQGSFAGHYPLNPMQGNLNLPSNLQAAVSSYLQSYQNQIGNQAPFGQSKEQIANSFPHQIPQFNPSRQDSDYYAFLNNLLRDQTVRKYASPAEIAHFASQWADHSLAHFPSQEEVHRLFDSHALPRPALKALPPIDITPELIESLNEPNQTRAVLCSLVQKIQQRLHLFKQSLLLVEQTSGGSSARVKDLACFKEISIMWTELKGLKDKVKEMMEKDNEIQKKGLIFERNVSEICQKYKQSFAEVNKNITMVEESQKKVSVLSKYLQFHIQPIFKAFLSSSPIPIEDPDQLILSVTASLAAKTESLARNIDDCLALSSPSVQQQYSDNGDPVKLVHSVCLFYQEVAGEVFRVSEKMRKAVNLAARENHRKGEDIQRKVGEKVKLILGRKLEAYYLINQIQQILQTREYGDQTEARVQEGRRERQISFN